MKICSACNELSNDSCSYCAKCGNKLQEFSPPKQPTLFSTKNLKVSFKVLLFAFVLCLSEYIVYMAVISHHGNLVDDIIWAVLFFIFITIPTWNLIIKDSYEGKYINS